MNDYELSQVQNIEFEILSEINRICKKHNIKYVLMGGTCLGAVRHKTIIPWDDDIDVGMLREDYDKFISICEKELDHKYFFQHFKSEKKCGFIFGKIRKNNTKLIENYGKNVEMHQGIWVDIFPFDYVSENATQFKKEYNRILFYRNLLIVKVGFSLKEEESWIKRIQYNLVKLIIKFIPLDYLKNKIERLMRLHNEDKTNILFPYGCAWGEKEKISVERFNNLIEVPFGKQKAYIFKSYDQYLKELYGNYMEYPPLEKRNSGHDVCKIEL